MSQPDFTIEIFQNQYMPEGGREVNAIATVTSGDQVAVASASGAEIIMVDCSGSMSSPQTKIAEARAATAAAVDVIRDGVAFAVIAGTAEAWPVYPSDGTLAVASERTRAEARAAVGRLRPSGGTAIGTWLRLAYQMFTQHPATLRHAILLTDGKNQHESAEQLDAAIALCQGVFSCDCRGVGTDWEVGEIRRISTALLGTVDIVREPSGLAADFAAMMESAMGKQVAPTVDDLTSRRTEAGPQAGDYPTGAWGASESRDYHVCVQVSPGGVGQEMLAARISLVAASPGGPPEILGQGRVMALWTDDEALSTQINQHVAHYTGQAELAQMIEEGLAARKQGDEDTATSRLGRAVALAAESGNEGTAKLLAKVVDVVDEASGTVRLKKKVDDGDIMELDARGDRTVRTVRTKK
jgi:hypothetical protein